MNPAEAIDQRKLSTSEDEEVVRVLDAYLADLEAGLPADPDLLLRQHPAIANRLRACLAGLQMLDAAAPAQERTSGELGDYSIVREVGRGGMGVVYEAVQRTSGRRVALKVLPFAASLDPRQLQRFKNEANAASHLHHPHIVPVYEVGYAGGTHYYTMQFVEGQSLSALWREQRRRVRAGATPKSGDTAAIARDATRDGRVPLTELRWDTAIYVRSVAELARQAAEALDHAHQVGVIHRDIKPGNLLVDKSGHLWVTDFGLASMQGVSGLTATGDVLGTLRYMSPEQASARRGVVDHRTDVYSLGVTLYELLTLRPAFEGRDREEVLSQMSAGEPRLPSRLNAAVPRDLETIVLTAMARLPQERYATAKALAADIGRFLGGQPIHAKRPGILARLGKWARRHRAWVAAIGLFAIILASGATVSSVLVARARHGEELQRAAAAARKLESRAHLYAYHMNVAMADWQKGNVARVLEQLAHERPAAGEEDLRGFEWFHLLRLSQGNSRAVFEGGTEPVRAVATSADGSVWASATEDGAIRLWDPQFLAPRGVIQSSGGTVYGLAVSPDGQRLAAGCANGAIEIWDLQAASLLHRLTGHSGAVTAVAYFHDGRRLVSTGHDGRVCMWDTVDGLHAKDLVGIENGGNCVGVSPDGKIVAAAGNGRKVLVWDLTENDQQAHELGEHRTYVHCLAFSPCGQLLLTGSEDGLVHLWDLAARRLNRKWRRHTAAVAGAAFAPQGHDVATVSWDGSVKVWNPDSPTAEISLQQGHAGQALAVAFAPDGKSLLSGGGDGAVRVSDLAAQREPLVLTGHRRLVRSVAFAADGQTLFSSAADGTARSWDLAGQHTAVVFDNLAAADGGPPADERDLPKWAVEHQCVMGAVLLGGQTQLLTGDVTGELRLWDAVTGSPLLDFESAGGPLWALARSPDGMVAAGAGYTSNVVTLWDTTTGKVRRVLRGHTDRIWSVAFSPDSRLVASGSNDYTVRVWDVASGLEVARIPAPAKYVFCVAISPDGRMVAIGGEDNRVRLYDLKAAAALEPLGQHPANLHCLAFFPDGKSLATGGVDGTVKLWDLATHQERLTLRVPPIKQPTPPADDTTSADPLESSVWSLAVSPDGLALAAGDGDGRITVWRAQLP